MKSSYVSRIPAGWILAGLLPLAGVTGAAPREANTSLQMPQLPGEPGTNTYFTEVMFGGLSFGGGPVSILPPPGETGRLFVVENDGFVSEITNLLAPTRHLFLDISDRVNNAGGEGLLGLAFHPDYASNGYFYVCYVDDRGVNPGLPATQSNRLDVLSRFQRSASDPHAADTNSEVVLIRQPDESDFHNLNEVRFGPDGYLYFSVGDEGDADDSLNNSQRIDKDFFSAIGRIDVDKRLDSLAPNPHPSVVTNLSGQANYAVPPDNPFIGATQFNGIAVDPDHVRTEFYAVGLRNPWRFSFDEIAGRIYCGDVGQGAREEIDLITKGGNYGWAYREGLIPGPKSYPVPPDLPGNLLTNPSVEEGSGATVFNGWVREGSQNVFREEYTTFGYALGPGTFPHGDRALKAFGDGSRLTQTNLPVTAGSNYTASGFFYHSTSSDGVATNALGTRLAMEVTWFDAAQQTLGVVTSAIHHGLTFPDTWLEIRMSHSAPPGATHAAFSLAVRNTMGSGSVWGDLFYFGDGNGLPPVDAAGNLLENPSMESGESDSNFMGWVRDGSPSTFRRTTEGFGYTLGPGTFPDGDMALKAWGSEGHLFQTNLPVDGGSSYVTRALFYHSTEEDGIATNALSTRISARVEWQDTNGAPAGEVSTPVHNGLSPADQWVAVWMTNIAPTQAVSATFHLETDSDAGGGSLFGDTFYFGRPPVPGPKILVNTGFVDPIYQYGQAGQSKSVTGGFVYRGDRFPELVERYVFADFSEGSIRSLWYDGTNASEVMVLTHDAGIAGLYPDPRNGDVLLADVFAGQIKRLARQTSGGDLPNTLADAGVFTNLELLIPNAGIVPYELNVPFWSDGARKQRWFSLPDVDQTIGFNAAGNWSFPTGTVWIKHFELELTNGVPASARRLETRILVKNQSGGYGVTYRWGQSTTNAELVPAEGLNDTLLVHDGSMVVTQVWRYPSRAECLACHTDAGGIGLGFNTPQLNRLVDHGQGPTNQLEWLDAGGYFSAPVTNRHLLRALADRTNLAYSLEYRARSYLQVNCGQCHVPNGPVQPDWNAGLFTPLSKADMVNALPLQNLGDPANRIVAAGDPAHSILLTRISTNGALRMPPLASNVLDTNSISLITEWINSLAGFQTFAEWQMAWFGSTNAPGVGPGEDADDDHVDNQTEYLTGTDPNDDDDAWSLSGAMEGAVPGVTFPQVTNRIIQVEATTNLADQASWQPLNAPGNEPSPAAVTSNRMVADPDTNLLLRFYRARVLEP